MPEQECIFCNIVGGKVPSKKIYEDDKVIAIFDINPAIAGHVLVIPKEHVFVMPQMSEDLVRHLGVVAKAISHKMLKNFGVEGVSVFIANGAPAGQRAPHFMMHIIPRKEGDGIELNPSGAPIPDEQLNGLLSRLKPAVDKYFKGVMPAQPQRSDLDKISDLLT